MNDTTFQSWRHALPRDLFASIVVFLVALPLCMGIAIASGMPPAAGLVTGIVGGLLVGFFSGSPLQVSGPAAGLAVMVFEIVHKEGVAVLAVAIAVGGAIQFAAGMMRFGQWFRAVSPAVIRGMLTGIGVLIFASQFHVMVDDAPRDTGLMNILSIPVSVVKGVSPTDDTSHHLAAIVGLATIVVTLIWSALRRTPLRYIPGPLAAVVVGTLLALFAGWPINLVEVPANLLSGLHQIRAGDLHFLLDGRVLLAGLAIAFVASAETLLCATAVDQMHSGVRTRYDKELAAQGVGNIICGTLGALPMTGVIVRSSANVEAGGLTRLSSILHGLWLLVLVVALPFVLNVIPTACLAAILVYTGYKLMDFKALPELWRYDRFEAFVYTITIVMIVIADLLTGVLIGVGISAARLLYLMSQLEITIEDHEAAGRTEFRLRGAATFVSLPKLAETLDRVPKNRELHVHLEALSYIDHACLDLIMQWEKRHESNGGRLVIDWEQLTALFRRSEPGNGGDGKAARRPLPRPVNAAPAH